jgi:hypothetical protein
MGMVTTVAIVILTPLLALIWLAIVSPLLAHRRAQRNQPSRSKEVAALISRCEIRPETWTPWDASRGFSAQGVSASRTRRN